MEHTRQRRVGVDDNTSGVGDRETVTLDVQAGERKDNLGDDVTGKGVDVVARGDGPVDGG